MQTATSQSIRQMDNRLKDEVGCVDGWQQLSTDTQSRSGDTGRVEIQAADTVNGYAVDTQ